MEIVVLIWIACGIIAAVIGHGKGEGCSGFVAGILLGPIGVLLALGSRGNRRPCPYCREMIHRQALVCPRCQHDLTTAKAKRLDPTHRFWRSVAKKVFRMDDTSDPPPRP